MGLLVYLFALVGVVVSQNWDGHGPRYNFKPAPLAHDGRVLDTPEINQAKQAHFAAHDAAVRALPNQRPGYTDYINEPRNNDYGNQRYTSSQYNQKYQPQQDNSQKYQDYRDYDNYDDRSSDDYSSNNVEKKWRGPLAKIQLTNDGKFVKETPEVAHARQQHLAAFSAVKQSRPSVGYEGNYEGAYNRDYQGEGGQRNYNNGGNSNYQSGNQYGGGSNQQEDDGSYRGEDYYSGQYNQPRPSYGPANQNQNQGGRQGYY